MEGGLEVLICEAAEGELGLVFFFSLAWVPGGKKERKKVGEGQRGGIVALLGLALLSRVDGDGMGWAKARCGS